MNTNHFWIPACGGTEKPFTYKGREFLYMWNTVTGEHDYYCISDDLFLCGVALEDY